MDANNADRRLLPDATHVQSREEALVLLLQYATRSADVADFASMLAQVCVRKLPCEVCAVFTVAGQQQCPHVLAVQPPVGVPPGCERIATTAVRRNSPVLVEDAATTDDCERSDPGFTSAIAVASTIAAVPVGSIVACSSRKNTFGAQDAGWLQAAGDILAFVLHLDRSRSEWKAQSEELQQFAYVASHDLQEPLRTIVTYSLLLQKRYAEYLGAEAREMLELIADGTRRMQAMIQGLLEYSRLTPNPGVREEYVDCEAVLRIALMNLGTAITESGAEITHSSLPRLQADGTRLAQVFANLVSNAIKYRGSAPPHVHIEAKEDGPMCVFSVSDNGIGIDPAFQERIFGVFSRLHGREIPGTGVGLAICKKIVEGYGGQIWLTSEPGTGSTFYFSLPRGI